MGSNTEMLREELTVQEPRITRETGPIKMLYGLLTKQRNEWSDQAMRLRFVMR